MDIKYKIGDRVTFWKIEFDKNNKPIVDEVCGFVLAIEIDREEYPTGETGHSVMYKVAPDFNGVHSRVWMCIHQNEIIKKIGEHSDAHKYQSPV